MLSLAAKPRRLIVLLPLLILLIFIGIFVVLAPWRPKFPVEPGTEAIAYTSSREVGRQIFLIRPDGTQETRLTYHIRRAVAWLPIPTYFGELVVNENLQRGFVAGEILYVSDMEGHTTFYQSRLDGSAFTHIDSPLRENYTASFSPNGQWIAYTRNDGKIVVLNRDGSNEQCVTCTFAYRAAQPTWSPDGTTLAFPVDLPVGSAIYTVRADGTALQRLTPVSIREASGPAWSPDGTRIAFSVQPRDGLAYIYVMNRDGSAITQLTNFAPKPGVAAGDGNPTWSPDGTRIAFTGWRVNSDELYTMNADGSDQRRITHSGKVSGPLVWIRVP